MRHFLAALCSPFFFFFFFENVGVIIIRMRVLWLQDEDEQQTRTGRHVPPPVWFLRASWPPGSVVRGLRVPSVFIQVFGSCLSRPWQSTICIPVAPVFPSLGPPFLYRGHRSPRPGGLGLVAGRVDAAAPISSRCTPLRNPRRGQDGGGNPVGGSMSSISRHSHTWAGESQSRFQIVTMRPHLGRPCAQMVGVSNPTKNHKGTTPTRRQFVHGRPFHLPNPITNRK
jgi:hypothetical protein